MEKKILEEEFKKFYSNRRRGKFYYTDEEWDDLQIHLKRINLIKKIWKKDTQ